MENLKNVAPIEDFNWDAYENGESFAGASHEELEKAYDGTLNKVNDREVVDGTVIAMNKREVVVNIGYKSDGIIPLNEFRYNPDLKVGDTVEVYIENQEDKKGQLVLSHRKARATRSWDRVNAALENEEIIKGYIKCRTKGGMIVDVFGIEAFLPGSQIDVKPIRDYDVFVGKTMEFKVVKINQEFKNVVVSHKALIEAELEQQKKEIIGKLEKGQVLEGTVKNITSYGVFIDLGGVDGLIHITDLSWGRVSDPKEVVELDQKLNVVILDFDDEKKRIALGLKQLTPHPWDALDPNLQVGEKHQVSGFWPGDGTHSMSGFLMRKMISESMPAQYHKTTLDYIVFRYAEVLLNYAEAVCESGLGDKTIAAKALNDIRKRAAHTNEIELTRENVRNERFVELAFENIRIWDLRRWRVLHTLMNNFSHDILVPMLDLRDTNPSLIFVRKTTIGASLNGPNSYSISEYYEDVPRNAINQMIQNP